MSHHHSTESEHKSEQTQFDNMGISETPHAKGSKPGVAKKKRRSSPIQKLQQHNMDPKELKKTNLNVSAGRCFYEKAKSRRSRHRLALANQPCVPLKAHVERHNVFADEDEVQESFQKRGVDRLYKIAAHQQHHGPRYPPAAVSAKARQLTQQCVNLQKEKESQKRNTLRSSLSRRKERRPSMPTKVHKPSIESWRGTMHPPKKARSNHSSQTTKASRWS